MHVISARHIDSLTTELRAAATKRPTFVLYFHSSDHVPADVAREIESAFPGIPSLGCTTAGEIKTGEMLNGAIVVSLFHEDVVKSASVAVISDESDVKAAYRKVISAHPAVDLSTHAGLVLFDGLSGKEEQIMDSLGNCTDMTFVGGSAGDDLKFTHTTVCANGSPIHGVGVLAVLHVPSGFDLIKTQSFTTTGKKLTPTKVNGRTVVEFDGKPAAIAYAEAVGLQPSGLDKAFMSSPLGLMAGDEPYVRSPQRVEGDRLHFYCAVHEGIELSVLQGQDMIADTKAALAAKQHRGLIAFNCILRTLDLRSQGQEAAYGQIFTEPTIGFSTYGEAYIGHINQTATILALR